MDILRNPISNLIRNTNYGLVVFLMLVEVTFACGPGRGMMGHMQRRKLTPLVFKEHSPNMPENAYGASRQSEGPISRDSPNFANLVPNYNRDILFKDDEGTGADRLMSQVSQVSMTSVVYILSIEKYKFIFIILVNIYFSLCSYEIS